MNTSLLAPLVATLLALGAANEALSHPDDLRMTFVPDQGGPAFVLEISPKGEKPNRVYATTLVWMSDEKSFSRSQSHEGIRESGTAPIWPQVADGPQLSFDPDGKALLTIHQLGDWQKGFLPVSARSEKIRQNGPPVVLGTSARIWFGDKTHQGLSLARDYMGPATLYGSATAFQGYVEVRRGVSLMNTKVGFFAVDGNRPFRENVLPGEVLSTLDACDKRIPVAFYVGQSEHSQGYSQLLVQEPTCIQGQGLVARTLGYRFEGNQQMMVRGMMILGDSFQLQGQ